MNAHGCINTSHCPNDPLYNTNYTESHNALQHKLMQGALFLPNPYPSLQVGQGEQHASSTTPYTLGMIHLYICTYTNNGRIEWPNGFNAELESEPVPPGLLLFLPFREASFYPSTYCRLFSLSLTQVAEGCAHLESVHTHM